MNTLLFASLSSGAASMLVFCLGACAAAFANYCVDVFGWTRRYRSPWRRFPRAYQSESPVRSWATRIPVLGWLFLAKLAFRFGGKSTSAPGWESKTFWIRPFLTEIFFAAFVTWRFLSLGDVGWRNSFDVWSSWFVEFVFFWILLCASYVDFDDYIIPDATTIPGAILGLAFSFAAYRNLILSPTNFPLDFGGESFTPSICEWFYLRSLEKGRAFDSSWRWTLRFFTMRVNLDFMVFCAFGSPILSAFRIEKSNRNIFASIASIVVDSRRLRNLVCWTCRSLFYDGQVQFFQSRRG